MFSFSMNSSYGVDECADVCTSANMTSTATLSGCVLTFTATQSGVWYAIALQVTNIIMFSRQHSYLI